MNAKAASKEAFRYTAQRAKRYNLWALVSVLALCVVLVVKGQTSEERQVHVLQDYMRSPIETQDSKAETNP